MAYIRGHRVVESESFRVRVDCGEIIACFVEFTKTQTSASFFDGYDCYQMRLTS